MMQETMRKLVVLALFAYSGAIFAQDVIVKKDGSTIISKVLEVDKKTIKYKKFSNLGGPTYSVDVEEITSINYENGERDVFTETNKKTENTSTTAPAPTGASEASRKINEDYLNSYNNYSVKYTSDKVGGPAKRALFTLAYGENSVIMNDELSASINIGQVSLGNARGQSTPAQFSRTFSKGLGYQYFMNQALLITLTNKTQKTIYVDLANSFYRRGQEASPYYIPKATSTMQSTTGSVSVGIPTFFGAVGVGSSQTNAVSVTTYTQRIIAIPPQTTKSLEPEMLFPKDYNGTEGLTVNYSTSRMGYFPVINIGNQQMSNGDIISFSHENSPIKIGAFITYGFDESMSATETLSIDLYAREMTGFPFPAGAAAYCANAEKFIEKKGSTLSFITVVDDGKGKNGIMTISNQ